MRLPSPNNVLPSGRAYFTADQAFDVYAAQVAHTIHVEVAHLVPWSIQSHPAAELDELLASSAYFARIGKSETTGYPAGIVPGRDFQEAPENDALGELNGDPRIGYDFLGGKNSSAHRKLIAETELETLVNLTEWLRENVSHGPMDDQKAHRVALQRWLDERLRAPKGGKTAIAVEGCHSSSKLMVDLARSVNIPLLHARALDNKLLGQGGHFFNRTHGGLVYGWGGKQPRILWHTDEINASQGMVLLPHRRRRPAPWPLRSRPPSSTSTSTGAPRKPWRRRASCTGLCACCRAKGKARGPARSTKTGWTTA